jgi:hypothetical protein
VLGVLRKVVAASALTTLAGLGLLAILPAAPAAAQVYPPSGCTLGASVSVATAGSSITVTGSGFDPGQVAIFFDSDQVATATAAGGTFSVVITVPSNASPGTHVIRAVPADAACDPTTTITVQAGAGARAPAAAGALAFTGSDSLPLVWIALAMLTVGTAFVLAVRRRAQARRSLKA